MVNDEREYWTGIRPQQPGLIIKGGQGAHGRQEEEH